MGTPVLHAFLGHVRDKVESWTFQLQFELQVLDVTVVSKAFEGCLCHLYGEWLLSGTCPLAALRYLQLGEWIKTVSGRHLIQVLLRWKERGISAEQVIQTGHQMMKQQVVMTVLNLCNMTFYLWL
jgi:hypothetical protein